MKTKISLADKHALGALATLRSGAYCVMVMEEDDVVCQPCVAPIRGAALFVDGRWMVFSPMEVAN